MIGDHDARIGAALLLSLLLVGCEDKAAKAAHAEKECFAARLRFKVVVDAMCTPWGERREMAISMLAEEVMGDKVTSPDSDPSEGILDIASRVSAKDCVRAGYPDPGRKVAEPRRSPPPEFDIEVAKARMRLRDQASKAPVETGLVCDLWGDDVPEGVRVKGSAPDQDRVSDNHP